MLKEKITYVWDNEKGSVYELWLKPVDEDFIRESE